jgi:hypothetical protein
LSEKVYVVEIRHPGGDDDWLVAYYGKADEAPATFTLAVFGSVREAAHAADVLRLDPSRWDVRVRLASLSPRGRELRPTGRGITG